MLFRAGTCARLQWKSAIWRDNLDENGAAIRMRSGGRGASWSRRTLVDASPLALHEISVDVVDAKQHA